MDLCSAAFYVERAKISRMFNHGAFWNKLNIYPSARPKKKKKNSAGIFFVCTEEKGPWENKIKQHCQRFECLFIDLSGSYLTCLFCAGLWGFSQIIHAKKREKVVYLFIFVLSGIVPFTATRDPRLVFVFFGMVKLSSLSPPHWAQISILWRQLNVTKRGAICSTVMHHRLTADIISAV